MKKSLILRSQADDVFLIINQFKMNPEEFIWQETESYKTDDLIVSKLIHIKTNSYFQFDINLEKHYCIYSPAETTQTKNEFVGGWQLLISTFKNWLNYLKREISTPNLWGQIEKVNILTKGVADFENNLPFEKEEYTKIHTSLNEIKEYLSKAINLSVAENEFLNKRIEYLEESSIRLGRKDWVSILVGVLFNILMGLLLPPETAKELFRITLVAFKWLFDNNFLLPK